MLRSLFPAESGRSGGGQVNMVTRSGGDEFHGSAFEFIRNEAFNANNFLTNAHHESAVRQRLERQGETPAVPLQQLWLDVRRSGLFPKSLARAGPACQETGAERFFFFSQEFRQDRRFTARARLRS